MFWFFCQEIVKVHVGADAVVWCTLHCVHGHAVHRRLWDSLADPDAL